MRQRGIRTLFYFQVDNPLVEIADPAFLGHHRQADAEMSFKVIEKVMPDEKLAPDAAETAADSPIRAVEAPAPAVPAPGA